MRERTGRGESLYELDEDTLEELGVDLIVTQAVCEVCAVSFDDVQAVAGRLPTRPEVISLDPSTLGEVLADVPRLAAAAGAGEAGDQLAAEAAERLEAVERAVDGAPRPRVAALEWLDPLYVGGHWVPQMIELAGGEDVLGLPGEKSRTAEWAELEAVAPEVIVSMPCGYYAEQAAAETTKERERLAPTRRAGLRRRCRGVLLAPRPAARRGRGAAGPPAAPRARAGAADPALDRARPDGLAVLRDRDADRRHAKRGAGDLRHVAGQPEAVALEQDQRGQRSRRRGRRCARRSRCSGS